MKNSQTESLFERNMHQGIEKGYISISEDSNKIT
jgi:hypothetical protein